MNIWTIVCFSFVITSFSALIWTHVNYMFDCVIQKEQVQKETYLLDALAEFALDHYNLNKKDMVHNQPIQLKSWPLNQADCQYQACIEYDIQPEKVIVKAELIRIGCGSKVAFRTLKI
ncbi:hypothetical protein M1446_01125 [Candidatus Dependentiae bacterium]|nr:hypothetical protein [Candidatus Dependentiae bacterium]